jgi:hypothetical protein
MLLGEVCETVRHPLDFTSMHAHAGGSNIFKFKLYQHADLEALFLVAFHLLMSPICHHATYCGDHSSTLTVCEEGDMNLPAWYLVLL